MTYREQKKNELTVALEKALTCESFLKQVNLSRKEMLHCLAISGADSICADMAGRKRITCSEICVCARALLSLISSEPPEGWLKHLFDYTLHELYPERDRYEEALSYHDGMLILYEIIHTVLSYDRSSREFSPVLDFDFPSGPDIADTAAGAEFRSLMKYIRKHYIYEFMRIGAEITPFNTVGHVAGVHYVAMHMAYQMHQAGLPIDLALASGSAAMHDIGKYGCKDSESCLIPHLHYYYTNDFLVRNGFKTIAHVAGNHSTWDLELENLSVENLILIYADFRVKSRRENGVEIVEFHTLEDSFSIILNKLENVDDAKRDRYVRVYNKLKDFEDYMVSLGADTDFSRDDLVPEKKKDPSLCTADEALDRIKYLAIEHNISVMSSFNNETAFGDLIESARSEHNWKNTRAYLNIISEYHSYMTKVQKKATIFFLNELLSNREGDIRRQAAAIAGRMIANFDNIYRKDLPDGVNEDADADFTPSGIVMWKDYLQKVVYSDLQTTEQQRRWIGYTLKITLPVLLKSSDAAKHGEEIRIFIDTIRGTTGDPLAAFIITDTICYLPLSYCSDENAAELVRYALSAYRSGTLETKVAALRFMGIAVREKAVKDAKQLRSIANIAKKRKIDNDEDDLCVTFMREQISAALGDDMEKDMSVNGVSDSAISDIFRENLKVGTSWIVKTVNIELLLSVAKNGRKEQMFHIATHLSNLLKVSERVTVRQTAGESLLRITPFLALDQRNELAVELTKGLEMGEYQFSKYIPKYLGRLAMWLHPDELDELLYSVIELIHSSNDKATSLALDAVGSMLVEYGDYPERFREDKDVYDRRKNKMIGFLLQGMASYHPAVSQEAFMVTGQYVFASKKLDIDQKFDIFRRFSKKLLTLIDISGKDTLTFFNNASSLNHIYRFIAEYIFIYGKMSFDENRKVAFFPGTFDPFSLSHKGIVTSIRDMGFDVYLALDEFSWSKKTQPRMIRKKIISMSVADEENVYIFPDDEPVNISNPDDIKRLKEVIPGGSPYIVVESDVIANASSYRAEPSENSVQTLNHIIFRRKSREMGSSEKKADFENALKKITGNVIHLTLPTQLEDISSTKIRNNIDNNRDISVLVDPVAQNYIYDNGLYLREPQYKFIIPSRALRFTKLRKRTGSEILKDLSFSLDEDDRYIRSLAAYMDDSKVYTTTIRDDARGSRVTAFICAHQVELSKLYDEFGSQATANHIRECARGRILVIRAFFADRDTAFSDPFQMILSEALTDALKRDYSYAVYHPINNRPISEDVKSILTRQGFREILSDGVPPGLFAADMKNPVFIFNNMDTVLKDPFDKNEAVLDVIDNAHKKLQYSLTEMYPDSLVLSINAAVMHQKLIKLITAENGVSTVQRGKKKLGPYMCVPFGKILKGIIIPNTVTKTLHTQKNFTPDLIHFTIDEYPYYASIDDQVRTLRSFNRKVILVDDLLHKGYRMRSLNPILNENDVKVQKLMVGLLSGRGKDLMTVQGRDVDSVYYTPNLKAWFVESSQYPFIGGDGVKRDAHEERSTSDSINLILPYVSPSFLRKTDQSALYDFSMTTLENARDILKILEQEYQTIFKRKLTLKRLSEAVISPMLPDTGTSRDYDMGISASRYVEDDIERLGRLKGLVGNK